MASVAEIDEQVRERERALDAFEAEVAGHAGVRNAADGRLVAATAVALTEGWWDQDGVHTPIQWLMWRAGLSRVTARRVTLVASRAAELPTTMRLLGEGRLSLDQAYAVARSTPAEYERSVCSLAVRLTVTQIQAATRKYAFDVEAKPPRERDRPREMSFGNDDDGSWWARIRLAADDGKAVEEALQATRERLHRQARKAAGKAAEAEGRPTKGTDAELGVPKVGWADALVGMAHSVLSRGGRGAETGTCAAVHLHLEKPEEGHGDDWLAELHGGPSLPSWLRRYLLCDCDIEIVWTADGIPVSTSRHHRTPPRRIRRLIEKRDGYRCRTPGCDQTLWLQVHHIVHWEDGGETLTPNLVCLCAHHHRMHHQGLLGIDGNADIDGGLVFRNRHGRVLDAAGQIAVPQPRDMPDVEPYSSPTGERLQTKWVWFQRNPDGPPTGDSADAAAPPDQRSPAA